MVMTIKDVAKLAGVSPSTVSRVINNKGVISKDTIDRVNKAMQELNYFPNSIARSFVNGNTFMVGLVVDIKDRNAFANSFFNQSVLGIETVLYSKDYNLLISNDRILEDKTSLTEKLVFERKVDGIIIPPSIVKKSLIRKLREIDFPYVVLGEPAESNSEINWVDVNNRQGGEQTAAHLIAKGYKRIAFISSGEKEVFNKNRIAGYCEALRSNHYEVDESLVVHGQNSVESGYKLMKELLHGEERTDAVICSGNLIAFGVIKAAKEEGLNIPDDFGVVSFDNYPIAEFTEPSITTVDIDTFRLGEEAAEILMKSIEHGGNAYQQTLISTRLIPRKSTERR